MNLLEVLKQYEELEAKMAELYRMFSESFAQDEQAALFFYRLSGEEMSHRDLIRFQLRLVQKDSAVFDGIDLELPALNSLLAKVGAIFQSPRTWSLKEAIRFALAMENDAGEFHLRSRNIQPDQPLSQLLHSLGRADRAHGLALVELAETHGIQPDLQLEGTITADDR